MCLSKGNDVLVYKARVVEVYSRALVDMTWRVGVKDMVCCCMTWCVVV